MNEYGYMKVAAAVPNVRVADCGYNAERITAMMRQAAERGAEAVVFPELSVTGYTCGDLFNQSALLAAAEEAAGKIVQASAEIPITAVIGIPVAVNDKLYNCAAVIAGGEIAGIVPKSNIPNYSEFYEMRWFASGAGIEKETVTYCGEDADFGSDLLFDIGGVRCGVEICEDLWVPVPPSSQMALNGAKVIFNLSASPEAARKNDYLRQLIEQQSARTLTAYVYASAGQGESSTDLVFAGNTIIAECGRILASGERFTDGERLTVADIDIELTGNERRRRNTFSAGIFEKEYTIESIEYENDTDTKHAFDRTVDAHPFVPSNKSRCNEHCREIFEIQSLGLAQRLRHTGCKCAVIGISGGLDSTLALLVAVRTFDRLGLDRKGIIGVTMPGFGTTDRTYNNALTLMHELGITMREIPIRKACEQHFADIGLDPSRRDAAYENSQARERTQILMDTANMEGGMVIGTGDLSEAALGWATYNGDHMSMYNVNCSIPKTLVRALVSNVADNEPNAKVAAALRDVVDTPVSPELLPADNGEIAQKTEDLVGPYELHDFFIFNILRYGFSPAKVEFLARNAFRGRYDDATIRKWLEIFIRRFFAQQYKRSAVPDGPKVGSVSLSPRGDWRMPSDASAREWLESIEK
ncbi:MAG: NAD(+) synthase [Alistipes sp.]|nr:NAD(+) synthase [Alistipes sp.]